MKKLQNFSKLLFSKLFLGLLVIGLAVIVMGCDDGKGDEGGTPETPTPEAPATDTTAPTVMSATLDGANIVITLSEAVTGSPDKADFTVSGMVTNPSILGVLADGATITIYLNKLAYFVDTITVSYTQGDEAIKDAAGNALASFTSQAVTHSATFVGTEWNQKNSRGMTLKFPSEGVIEYWATGVFPLFRGTYTGSLPGTLALTVTSSQSNMPDPATGIATLNGTTLTVSGIDNDDDDRLVGDFVLRIN
jgi:hypothetical protein